MQKITPFLWFDNQAEDAMNRGETVLLTVDGRAVSEMRVVDGEYMETRREPAGVGSPIL